MRVIHAGNDPEQLDISADGTRLFVANEDAAQASIVDIKSGAVVATAKIGDEPEGVRLRPDGQVVYVTSEEDGDVAAIDTTTYMVLKRIPVGPRPRGIGFLPDGSRAYVTLENDAAIARDRQPASRVSAAHRARQTGRDAASPSHGHHRPSRRDDDLRHHRLVREIASARSCQERDSRVDRGRQAPLGRRPAAGRAILYTANGPSNDVSVVDLVTQQVVKKIPVGDRPWGVAVMNASASR